MKIVEIEFFYKEDRVAIAPYDKEILTRPHHLLSNKTNGKNLIVTNGDQI